MLRGGVRPDRHLHLRQKVADSVLSGDEKMNDSVFVGLYLYLVKGSVRQSSSGVNWKINVEFLMMMLDNLRVYKACQNWDMGFYNPHGIMALYTHILKVK